METARVLGDQLNLEIGALATVRPGSARVLMIESASKLADAPWHVQRAHFLRLDERARRHPATPACFHGGGRDQDGMVRQVRAAERLGDRSAVRLRATEVLALLDEGRL